MTGDALEDLGQQVARSALGALCGFAIGAITGMVGGAVAGWIYQPTPDDHDPLASDDVAFIGDLPRLRASSMFN